MSRTSLFSSLSGFPLFPFCVFDPCNGSAQTFINGHSWGTSVQGTRAAAIPGESIAKHVDSIVSTALLMLSNISVTCAFRKTACDEPSMVRVPDTGTNDVGMGGQREQKVRFLNSSLFGQFLRMSRYSLYDQALENLARVHIVPKSSVKLTLNATFKTSFRHALTGGGTSGSFGVPAEPDDKRPPMDIEGLDAHALERWETILHYMVSSGTGQTSTKPSGGVLFLLERSQLMISFRGAPLQITSQGFQFLLHSPHQQLWDLLLQYLRMVEERQMDLVEVLSFLFMLSTMELGREYSTERLGASQKAMLEDLRDYGLIWQRKPSSKRISPTRLATTLTSSSPPLPTTAGPQEGFIVLETNYRLYAYTDNALQTAVLNLFVSLKYRFPNLVVGSITRDSVRKALANGISADQIISYLFTHAHPQMRKNNPLLPVTVQDQIRLWELERNRLKSQEGYLYTTFASQADYDFVLNYAKEIGAVLWENSAKRCFFGTLEGHPNIRGFIERRTAATGLQ